MMKSFKKSLQSIMGDFEKMKLELADLIERREEEAREAREVASSYESRAATLTYEKEHAQRVLDRVDDLTS